MRFLIHPIVVSVEILTPEVTHQLNTGTTRQVAWDITNPKITGPSTSVKVSIWGYREDNGPELLELWTASVLHSDGQYTIPGFLFPSPTGSYRVGFVIVYEENPVPVDSLQ